MQNSFMERLSEHESELVRQFHSHPFFLNFSSQTDEELKSYLETEKWLLDRFKETNDTRYLKNIGTFKAVEDTWGLGP